MKKVIFYTKENCSLCDEAFDLLKVIQEIEPFEIKIKDIYKDDGILEKYQLMIPVIKINQKKLSAESINLETILKELKN